MRISALVVTYNTGAIVLDCLRHLQASQLSPDTTLEIIVYDNASQDDTPDLIAAQMPEVKLLRGTENTGFGGGNNRAFAAATGDIIALINPDLQLAPDALQTLADYCQAHPSVGIVAPRTRDGNGDINPTARPPYTVWRIALRYLGLTPFFAHWMYGDTVHRADEPTSVAWVEGSCMVLTREWYATLGGFDEKFFLYAEDTDLCQRTRELDKRVVYHPQAAAIHIGGTTTHHFHAIRVRGYHLSPLYYFRKRGKQKAVWLLKLLFTIELLGKSTVRRLRNLWRYDAAQATQAEAEVEIWLESLRY